MEKTTRMLLIGLIAGLILAFMLHAQETTSPTTAMGRFKIVAASYTVWLKNGPNQQQSTIFKVDSATGEAWRFLTGQDGAGKSFSYWMKIDQQ